MKPIQHPNHWHLDRWSLLSLLGGTGVVLVGFVLGMQAPPDQSQGWLSRMLYVHPPVSWVAYMAFFTAAAYAVVYLVRRNPGHDRMVAASVEMGLLFTGLALVSGMLWGRPTWGVYWTWEPRLTTTAIMFVVYVGYTVVRSIVEDPEMRAKASAAIAILGSINIPISYLSVKWWRSLHQTQSVDLTTGRINMQSDMFLAMMVSLVGFSLLFFAMTRLRGILAQKEVPSGLEVQHG
jgi:heme exporter protein C